MGLSAWGWEAGLPRDRRGLSSKRRPQVPAGGRGKAATRFRKVAYGCGLTTCQVTLNCDSDNEGAGATLSLMPSNILCWRSPGPGPPCPSRGGLPCPGQGASTSLCQCACNLLPASCGCHPRSRADKANNTTRLGWERAGGRGHFPGASPSWALGDRHPRDVAWDREICGCGEKRRPGVPCHTPALPGLTQSLGASSPAESPRLLAGGGRWSYWAG